MLKKILKNIFIIILLLLLALFFFAVIKPAYTDYILNKNEIVVDTSGERATSKNKVNSIITADESDSDEDRWKLEKKDSYDPFNFDDRILLYEGNINSDSMNRLIDILIEDIDSTTYSKVDINLNGVEISYDDKDAYSSNLINFKNSISESNNYVVEFEYSALNAVVNKVIISNT